MEYDEAKARLLKKLLAVKEGFINDLNGDSYSVQQLIKEVKKETPLGKHWIRHEQELGNLGE